MPSSVSGKTVAVGMSGGVDSSVAASLLVENGYQVFGLTAMMTREQSMCCSNENVRRARLVSGQLGIPHHVIDVHREFKVEIMDTFQETYLAGRTPSPCILCNQYIKFGVLLEEARRLGADVLATGHYAQVLQDGDGTLWLHRGVDRAKDQSYFLSRLSQAQLGATLLPLGGMHKPDVVVYAHRLHLASRASRESQDLCFLEDGDPGAWIDARLGRSPEAEGDHGVGDVVDTAGVRLGRHTGLHHYTIGQRRGLGIAVGHPVYVVRIDTDRNEVVVGPRQEVRTTVARVEDIVWSNGCVPAAVFGCRVQVRFNHRAAAAAVELHGASAATVRFEDEQFAITPGQGAVFYDGDRVLGGGWIGVAE